jgi:hypothetical protein
MIGSDPTSLDPRRRASINAGRRFCWLTAAEVERERACELAEQLSDRARSLGTLARVVA